MGLFIGLLGQFFTSNHFVGEVFSADPGYGSGVTFGSFFFRGGSGSLARATPLFGYGINAFTTGNPFGGTNLLEVSRGRDFRALSKGVKLSRCSTCDMNPQSNGELRSCAPKKRSKYFRP